MERTRTSPHSSSRPARQLVHLKLVSRLLGHELHAQNGPRMAFSREEVVEIQTAIDLFIEEVLRSKGATGALVPAPEMEVQAVPARVN
jgi:hypothetical protein